MGEERLVGLVTEVRQETFPAVRRAAGAFAGGAVVGTAVGWLWTVAARRPVDAFRRRAHHAEPPLAAHPAVPRSVPGLKGSDQDRGSTAAARAR